MRMNMSRENRILFMDNPWPKGHAIKEFVWGGRLDDEGKLWFDFHLVSDDYDAEDPDDFNESDEDSDDDGEWNSKIVWGNYHRCTLSSTKWSDEQGILIDPKNGKLNFSDWGKKTLKADLLPLDDEFDWEDLALHIYLMGHDACAAHAITISQCGANQFNIDWAGKIALAYIGHDEFKYDFNATIKQVSFDGFRYPQKLGQEQALLLFKKYLADTTPFEFVDLNPKTKKREYTLALKG